MVPTSWSLKRSVRKTKPRKTQIEESAPATSSNHQPQRQPGLGTSELRDPLEDKRQTFGMITAVVAEFQEFQCYLIIATQAAILIAIACGDVFEAASITQAHANCNFISATALISSAMNYLGIAMCSIVGVTSKWIRTLSGLALVISFATWILLIGRGDRCFESTRLDSSSAVAACGGHRPPNVYCGSFYGVITPFYRIGIVEVVTHSWFVLVLSTVLCIISLRIIRPRKELESSQPDMQASSSGPLSRLRNHPIAKVMQNTCRSFNQSVTVALVQQLRKYRCFPRKPASGQRRRGSHRYLRRAVLVTLGLLPGLVAYILIWLVGRGYIDFHEWGIGQIVAGFLWVPFFAHCIRWRLSQLSKFLPFTGQMVACSTMLTSQHVDGGTDCYRKCQRLREEIQQQFTPTTHERLNCLSLRPSRDPTIIEEGIHGSSCPMTQLTNEGSRTPSRSSQDTSHGEAQSEAGPSHEGLSLVHWA